MKSFKVGSIVLPTDQGLGYLAKSFYDNGLIDKVCIQKHSQRTNHYEWYKEYTFEPLDLLDCDVILMFETPFNWTIIPKAKEKGIKTILVPMYECSNFPFPEVPDEIWCPSALDYEFYTKNGVKNCKQIQIPIDVEWELREKAKVFVHNAGNGGLGGRNGTKELLEAMKYVKSPIKLIIRSQVDMKRIDDPRIEYRIGQFDDIWSEGDVFVFPEKFNGLSLPIQEAFASGMLVMATNRFPSNTYLPNEPLIEVNGYKKESIAVEFDMAIINPEKIANKIDECYNLDIKKYSLVGLDYNKKNSWKTQREKLKMLMSQ